MGSRDAFGSLTLSSWTSAVEHLDFRRSSYAYDRPNRDPPTMVCMCWKHRVRDSVSHDQRGVDVRARAHLGDGPGVDDRIQSSAQQRLVVEDEERLCAQRQHKQEEEEHVASCRCSRRCREGGHDCLSVGVGRAWRGEDFTTKNRGSSSGRRMRGRWKQAGEGNGEQEGEGGASNREGSVRERWETWRGIVMVEGRPGRAESRPKQTKSDELQL